ncbi:MAG: hypothetical protein LKF01_06260 [Lactobacillus sp.]|jgi:hypothetical protein|nr:hypothetical protein [Lactobacillus sp.]MCH3906211.1 hypothetical protein [Lactobacillus sp.]MCH3990210.1 hypothetical protein [Lactobacillus sp.]MCH4069076.1 hypothetical protein [Lactobacillus sp.]MCI1303937.1 hypothetical protein [Lactobacillus sp.]
MNNENVFFNPGDAIASSHDFKEARRSAQIYKQEEGTTKKLVIAKNKDNGIYAIYYADNVVDEQHGVQHEIKDKL